MKSDKKLIECTSCGEVKECNQIETVYEEKPKVIYLCNECEKEIDDIVMWANEYSLINKKEVECPYCYSIYNVDNIGTTFECEGCESTLEIKIDEEGIPYIEEE